MNVLLDTNIALYFLSGDKKLAQLLDNVVVHLSFISELELLSYPKLTEKEQEELNKFIGDCVVIDINTNIKRKAIDICQAGAIKLPDAIIAATAISERLPFFSADKDFEDIGDLYLFSYEI